MKGNLIIALVFVLLISSGFAALTTNKITFGNGTMVYLLDKGTNTTISANATTMISSVRVSQDGNNYIIVTTNNAIKTYDENLNLLHTATPSLATYWWNYTGCTRYNDNYYCGASNSVLSISTVAVFDLSGLYVKNYSSMGNAYGTVTIGTNGVIYVGSTTGVLTNVNAYYLANDSFIGNKSMSEIQYPALEYRAVDNRLYVTEYSYELEAYDLNANGSIKNLNSTYSTTYALYAHKTTTGSYLTHNATGIYEFDGSNYYNYTFPLTITTNNPMKIAEYTQTGSQSGGQEGSVQFVMDWNQNGVYESNAGNYSYNGFTNDWVAPYLNVTVKDISGYTVGNYQTDANGYINPTLLNNTYYQYTMQYVDGNYTKSGTFVSGSINRFFITNTVLWMPYGQVANGNLLTGVTYTFYNTATPSINQTKTAQSTFSAFYTVPSATNYYSITASKAGYTVQTYYNNNITGTYSDVKSPWALFGSQNFFITDVYGKPYTATAYSSGDYEGVTSNQLISKVKFKIFDASTGGFLTSKDFTEGGNLLPYVSIVDPEGVCNEETAMGTATQVVNSWADYNKYVGIDGSCTYYNDGLGERVECPATTQMLYSQNMKVVTGIVPWTRYYIVNSFNVVGNPLKIIKLSGTQDTFCLSKGDTGTCYLNYVCSKGTTNTLVATIIRNSQTYALQADFNITQGVITITNNAWVQNGTTQIFNIPVSFGQSADLTTVSCVANVTYADASTALYTLTPYAEGGFIRYWASLTGAVGAKRSEASYVYNTTCSGGNYATVSKAGTAYVSREGYNFKASPFCNVIPSTFPNTTAPMLYCEARTSEATAPLIISADVDVGVGASNVVLPLNYTVYLEADGSYLRVYKINSLFTNAVNGNSYTIIFTINGVGNYSSMTMNIPITIDNSAGTTTIDSVEFDKGRVTDGDNVTCTAVFSGSSFQSAQVDVWSQEFKADNDLGTLSNGSYEMWNHKFTSYSSDYAPTLKKIGADKYTISYTFPVTYCQTSDYSCFSGDSLFMKTSDTLWCKWRINYAEANASTSFKSSGASGDVRWVVSNFPFNLFEWLVGLLLNPFVFIILLLALAFLFAMKRG